ncbi:hypothetical protein [Variovorax sp. PAMC26660]|uniref:hypothetical protein n=1 Tax=Variovorax sp. PAMC26660 TaxID=2762322 RepID=UPI00164DD726|nr:hypothetical protein [Variovorax sp. PAMC26660]QNK66678.1 hypothetical protein H7F35_26380 [Variovorax sp. PAMC26660]
MKILASGNISFGSKIDGQLEKIEKQSPVRAAITREYLCEMRKCVDELSRIAMPGGRVVMIVGNNRVAGEIVENDAFLIDEFKARNLSLDLWLLDKIRARRLMRSRHETAGLIDYESILVFRKQ